MQDTTGKAPLAIERAAYVAALIRPDERSLQSGGDAVDQPAVKTGKVEEG